MNALRFRSGLSRCLTASAVLAGLLAAPALWSKAEAQSVRIVALGASNTNGKGVGRSAAFPARLQALLRAQGINAVVVNAGINGDTTRGMLARLGGVVSNGTRLVILDKAPANDKRRGVTDSEANIAAIRAALQGRGIALIVIPSMHMWADRQLQGDGLHLTAAGHQAVSRRLLPLVVAALGKGKS